MSYVEVIWNPEKSRLVDSSVPTFNCPIRFPFIPSAPAKGADRRNQNQELEARGTTTLIHGSNRIELEEWESMQQNPFIQRFIDVGAIHVITPRTEEGKELTGLTLDFNFGDARAVIAESLDMEWLRSCIVAESANTNQRQPGQSEQLITLCKQRIREIERSAKKTAMAAQLNRDRNEE